ncbi:LacI family DNA-binding transcriptional regulator [Brevundimonas sp. FT23042]|uniref:LacI family DNA-binding transcriptional regulator n=1 Tax=Brevundimonas sp. FT23042 TaxID=3393749 RepID=UPI003B589AE1
MSRRSRRAVTLADVARHAGVSTMTVSNVLNDGGRVGDATRERVLRSVSALNYVPNAAAARFRGARLSRVGLLYSSVESVFLNTLVAAISTEAAARGLQLLLRPISGTDPETARIKAEETVKAGAEALILIPPFAELLAGAGGAGLGVPVAALATATALEGMTTIRVDNAAAIRELADGLLSLGHRCIGFVAGPDSHSDSQARRAAFDLAVASGGAAIGTELIYVGDFTFRSGLDAGNHFLDLAEPPSAIIASNDDMAAGVLWVANQRGVSVPDQLAVTGFDDTLLATRVWPALTTVRQPITKMAGLALDQLGRAHRGIADPTDILVPHQIIVRGSTDTPGPEL